MTEKKNPKCPECRSTRTMKIGTYPTRHGPEQRYACWNCGRRFCESTVKRSPARGKKGGKK